MGTLGLIYLSSSEQEILKEEINTLKGQRTKLQDRIKELEDELKKTKEDLEKKVQAAQEAENEVLHALFNLLPNDKFLDSSRLKELADDNYKFDINGRKFSIRVENTAGKGEISPFPAVFSKHLYFRHVQIRDWLVKD